MNPYQAITQAPFDPNWLLSTTAQTTAALVGIIGGFLLSRVVAIISEKSALLVRLHELEARSIASQAALEPIAQEIGATIWAWFIDDQLPYFAQVRGNISTDEIASNFDVRGSDPTMIVKFAEELSNPVKIAYELIESAYPSPKSPPTDAQELRLANVTLDPAIDERIYECVAKAIVESRSPSGISPSLSNPPGHVFQPLTSDIEFVRHDANIAKQSEILTNISFIQSEIDTIRSKLATLKVPKRLNQGFYVLAIFALLGIVEPLYFMTENPVHANSSVRMLVYTSFLAGFSGLLLYISFALADVSIRPPKTLRQRLTANPGRIWKKIRRIR